MYALKVRINGGDPVIAGASDLAVLSAIISCGGKLGPATAARDEWVDFRLSVNGLTGRPSDQPDEHVRWLPHAELQVGDLVTVEVIETDHADPAISGKAAEKLKHDEREYFELCKRTYFEMRGKYEEDSPSS